MGAPDEELKEVEDWIMEGGKEGAESVIKSAEEEAGNPAEGAA